MYKVIKGMDVGIGMNCGCVSGVCSEVALVVGSVEAGAEAAMEVGGSSVRFDTACVCCK